MKCEHCGNPVRIAKPITKRQAQVLAFIEVHIDQHGAAPTYQEIADRFGMRSLATAYEHVTILERKGRVVRNRASRRAITVITPAA